MQNHISALAITFLHISSVLVESKPHLVNYFMKSNEWNQHGINRINPNEMLITQGELEEVHVTWHDFPEGNYRICVNRTPLLIRTPS